MIEFDYLIFDIVNNCDLIVMFFICRMCSLKSFAIVALICALSVSSQNADNQRARLLVSKQVLNKLLVQDSDILVKVCTHIKYLICFFCKTHRF